MKKNCRDENEKKVKLQGRKMYSNQNKILFQKIHSRIIIMHDVKGIKDIYDRKN